MALMDKEAIMTHSLSVAEAKGRLSELLGRASYGGDRFVIERRGRPVAAIVSVGDLERIDAGAGKPQRRGLLAAVGALADIEDADEILDGVVGGRALGHDREVDLE